MAKFDTIITGGTVANTCATFKADVGIRSGSMCCPAASKRTAILPRNRQLAR